MGPFRIFSLKGIPKGSLKATLKGFFKGNVGFEGSRFRVQDRIKFLGLSGVRIRL